MVAFNTPDRAADVPLRELMRVVTLRAIQQGDDIVPAGSTGTIVFVYPDTAAFEVEFTSPVSAVVLARPGDLKRA